jgi:hypothetical protein
MKPPLAFALNFLPESALSMKMTTGRRCKNLKIQLVLSSCSWSVRISLVKTCFLTFSLQYLFISLMSMPKTSAKAFHVQMNHALSYPFRIKTREFSVMPATRSVRGNFRTSPKAAVYRMHDTGSLRHVQRKANPGICRSANKSSSRRPMG